MRALTALVIGVAVGAAAVAFAPVVMPELRRYARPTAKALLKTTLVTIEAARLYAAEFSEDIEDLIAETQAEIVREETAQRAKPARRTRTTAKRPRKSSARKRAPRPTVVAA